MNDNYSFPKSVGIIILHSALMSH